MNLCNKADQLGSSAVELTRPQGSSVSSPVTWAGGRGWDVRPRAREKPMTVRSVLSTKPDPVVGTEPYDKEAEEEWRLQTGSSEKFPEGLRLLGECQIKHLLCV